MRVCQSKAVGKLITFPKFLDILARCAKLTFSPTGGSGLSGGEQAIYSAYKGARLLEAEMLCLLLERMELSEGFNNLEKRSHKPHTSRITLLPSRPVVESLS